CCVVWFFFLWVFVGFGLVFFVLVGVVVLWGGLGFVGGVFVVGWVGFFFWGFCWGCVFGGFFGVVGCFCFVCALVVCLGCVGFVAAYFDFRFV
ncbi:hypothetical protein DVA80_20825, partial [Acinetobacter baumannii]|uniref:hypothetical protein n=1 Tax=Acinetobacter baumannii TaxID=470 RepID=UPI000E089B92